MLINEEFKDLVQKAYEEAKSKGDSNVVVDEKVLGGLTLFVNKKPKYPMIQFTSGQDIIYVGSEEIVTIP